MPDPSVGRAQASHCAAEGVLTHARTHMDVCAHACMQANAHTHVPTYAHPCDACPRMHAHAHTCRHTNTSTCPRTPLHPCCAHRSLPCRDHGPRAPRSPLAQPRCIQQVGAGLGAEAGAELKGKAPKPQLGPQTGLMDTRQWR